MKKSDVSKYFPSFQDLRADVPAAVAVRDLFFQNFINVEEQDMLSEAQEAYILKTYLLENLYQMLGAMTNSQIFEEFESEDKLLYNFVNIKRICNYFVIYIAPMLLGVVRSTVCQVQLCRCYDILCTIVSHIYDKFNILSDNYNDEFQKSRNFYEY